MWRVYNFNPGPATLPYEVVVESAKAVLEFNNEGMSILEISHRSKSYGELNKEVASRLKDLLSIPDNYKVLFLQGGASTQFAMVPLNLMIDGKVAEYVETGRWAQKAFDDAARVGEARVVASSKDKEFSYIPKNINFSSDASYIHITSNNTIRGTQWHEFPDTGDVPLVADMSSDFLTRKIDVSKFGLIYAGAQKNIGPAGVTVVIIREDLLDRVKESVPAMFKYKTHAGKDSNYNTPPVFSIFVVNKMFEWIAKQGGVEVIEERNNKKAALVYEVLDSTTFYKSTVSEKADRSKMNVTFRLATEELEKKFIDEATENGFIGVKGHRSVGGIRISLYNGVTLEAVEKLVEFMKLFEKKYS